MTHTEAFIYLSNQRGCTQDATHRSLHTFSFGEYRLDSRMPFGNLLVFNEETLGGGCTAKYKLDDEATVLLIPIVGGLKCCNDLEEECLVEAGQSCVFSASKNSEFEISNPFETELIEFLQVRFRTRKFLAMEQFHFDLAHQKNLLIPFFARQQDEDPSCYIGRFDGRQDYVHQTKRSDVFAFVIEGVFEVKNRLLQQRDGLRLNNCQEVEFEALSNGAIILLLEF